MQFNIQQNDRRLSADNYRALWAAQDRLNRLGILKSTFALNKHIEPKYILNVMKSKPELGARADRSKPEAGARDVKRYAESKPQPKSGGGLGGGVDWFTAAMNKK